MMTVVALLLVAGVKWRQSSARCCSIGTRGCDQAADGQQSRHCSELGGYIYNAEA